MKGFFELLPARLFQVDHVPVDFGLVFLAGLTAYSLRFGWLADLRPVVFDLPFTEYLLLTAGGSVLFVFFYALAGLYAVTGPRRLDRVRDRLDLTATLTPLDPLSLSLTYGWRNDDYESDVAQIKPLAGRALADSAAVTPGDQRGLLEAKNQSITLDVTYSPTERLNLNAYLGRDVGSSFQRSLEYNENNKQNPSAVNTASLGPWTRATSQWTADFDDRNTFVGAGASYTFNSGAAVSATYASAVSKVDITYSGFGVTNFDGTPFPPNHEFAFPAAPPTIENTSQVLDLKVDFPDGLPYPAPAIFAASDQPQTSAWLPYQTRRGCPLDCSYCSTASIEGRIKRRRSPAAVVANIASWVRSGFSQIFFVDNTFNLPASYALELCRRITEAELKITWRCIFNPGKVSRPLVEAMAKAGCRDVPGV